MRAQRAVFIRQKRPAIERLDAKHVEVVAGGDQREQLPAFAGAAIQIHRREIVSHHTIPEVGLVAVVEEVVMRHRQRAGIPLVCGEDGDQAIRLRDRQRREQERIDDAENRRVRADA